MSKLSCLLAITAFALLSVEADEESRMVGGNIATKGLFPYHVQIRNIAVEAPFCGGSIVGERFVLTSTYCVKRHADEFKKLRVIVGEVDIRRNGTEHVVDKLISHPRAEIYREDNDIGLVRVATSFQYTENVQPIRLPTKDTPVESDGKPVLSGVISGWGPYITVGGQFLAPSDHLRWSTTEALSRPECLRLMKSPEDVRKVAPNTICLITPPKLGPCGSDGGGALTTKAIPEERVIVGVLSWTTNPCANQLPHVAARVFPHLDFIRKAMRS